MRDIISALSNLGKVKLKDRAVNNSLDLLIELVGDPPCDRGCEWTNYCRVKAVACDNFREYVRGDLEVEAYTGESPPRLRLSVARDV